MMDSLEALTNETLEHLTKDNLYLTQENSVLHERVRKLEIALSQETEACAKVADDRAEICRQAMKGPPESLPGVEVHCLNEALHIAQLIRSRR